MKTNRNYPLLLAGQALGAFGDNFLLAAILAPLTALMKTGSISEQQVNGTNATFSIVFFVPFILLAPLAGFVNDRMPKTSWLLGGNLIKLGGTLTGLAGILLHGGDYQASLTWQVVGYTIVGIGACLYSPAKYGVLPEIVEAERLVKANGMVEMLTLIAILGGFAGGAVIYDHTSSLPICYGASFGFYGLAAYLNGTMDRTPHDEKAQFRQTFQSFFHQLHGLLSRRRTGRILLGCGLFWLAGAFLRTNLQAWGISIFQGAGFAGSDINNTRLALLKASPILAIAAGSVLAGKLHRLGDLSRQWLYALGMAGGVALLGILTGREGFYVVIPALCVVGVTAGLLVVPLNAALQHETSQTALGKTIAVQNVVDYTGMLVGAGVLGGMTYLGWSAHQAFLGLAVIIVILTLGVRLSTKQEAVKPAAV